MSAVKPEDQKNRGHKLGWVAGMDWSDHTGYENLYECRLCGFQVSISKADQNSPRVVEPKEIPVCPNAEVIQ